MTLTDLLTDTSACSANRACFLLRVRPEKLSEYVAVHQQVWPDMLAALSRCGWRHYSLFLRPEDGLVVGYFEADDVRQAIAAMDSEDVNRGWQAEMAQYFEQPGGGQAEFLHQYFYLR